MDIRLTSPADAPMLSAFYKQNQDHLRPWEPLREAGYHSIESWQERLKIRQEEHSKGLAAHFMSCDPLGDEVLAVCSLTNIVRGPFQACNMGYAVSQTYQGTGLMKTLCRHVISYAFDEQRLNRIMANYMPRNHRSEALLSALGFEIEGLARKYLKINDCWEDHVLTSLLNPDNTQEVPPRGSD
jgi:ribosomal-protein-alanine N-acetyltransferase